MQSGAQEDAEEFLSSVLNGLHEEMVDLSEIALSNSRGGQSDNNSVQADSSDETNGDDWREVGPRNRSLPIRSAKVINTPIQDIFGGSLFSTVRTAGKDRCRNKQPFFALQLDISVSVCGDYYDFFTNLQNSILILYFPSVLLMQE